MNNEFQMMWEEAIICFVSVERDDMTKDCGLLVKILGGGECLKHLVYGRQLHIDYKPETTTVLTPQLCAVTTLRYTIKVGMMTGSDELTVR